MPAVGSRRSRIVAVLAAALTLLAAVPVRAALTITPANAGRGFVLSDYATGFPNGGSGTAGPIGVAFEPNASVLVTDVADGDLYSLPSHADNQAVGASNVVTTFASPFWALAQVQIGGAWHYYGSDLANFYELDPATGAIVGTIYGAGGLGIAPFPPGVAGSYAGHLFIGGTGFIWDVDPTTMTATPWVFGLLGYGDGMAFSPDGSRLYTVRSDTIIALSMVSRGAAWIGPGHPGEGYDGIAVGVGNLDGYVYVNCNNGDLWEFGLPGTPHAGIDNLLASGGSRGDFIAVDPNVTCGGGSSAYPSLLVTQTDRLTRLDPPGGGWFGPPTSSLQPVGSTTGVDGAEVPGATRLEAVSPDPASGEARVEFTLARAGIARVGVLDLQGREIAVIAAGAFEAGRHVAAWDGRTAEGRLAPAGVYFVRLSATAASSTRRVVRVR